MEVPPTTSWALPCAVGGQAGRHDVDRTTTTYPPVDPHDTRRGTLLAWPVADDGMIGSVWYL
jgi:hypothetical protein